MNKSERERVKGEAERCVRGEVCVGSNSWGVKH